MKTKKRKTIIVTAAAAMTAILTLAAVFAWQNTGCAEGEQRAINIQAKENAGTVKNGEELQFIVNITSAETANLSQNVRWSVSGNKSVNTVVDGGGKLTVGADEYIGGTLTVEAFSATDNAKIGDCKVKIVSPWDTQNIADITPGSVETVNIDGVDWYVLARAGNKVMLISKDILEERKFDTGDPQSVHNEYLKWKNSELRQYLNGDWLNEHDTLKAHVSEVTIKTRAGCDVLDFDTTTDKVFLLSEADLGGTQNFIEAQADDYTLGKAGVLMPESMRKAEFNGEGHWWWLRSPKVNDESAAGVDYSGELNFYNCNNYYGGVRPALWINLEE